MQTIKLHHEGLTFSAYYHGAGHFTHQEKPAYFPPEFVATDAFQELFKSVPMPRLATPEEEALFAVFLASDESDFFVGQAIPFSGGWAQ